MEQKKKGRPPQRNSRAAQTAQQHRMDRKEREHLENLRARQRRKARHRTGKRISRGTWKVIIIMTLILLVVIVCMLMFFRIGGDPENISVAGNQYYTREEVVEASGLEKGDNLLTLSRGNISGKILAKLPYVAQVQVTRKLPNTVILTIEEYDVTYAVSDTEGRWYLMTSTGKITEALPEGKSGAYTKIEDVLIDPPVIGEKASVLAGSTDAAAAGQGRALLTLLQELEAAELQKEIASVSVPSSYELCLWYGTQYYVKLGNTDNLAYKLEYLKAMVETLEDYHSGTIDLTFSQGSEARFAANES